MTLTSFGLSRLAICRPADGALVNAARIVVAGYALAGGARSPERVEVSADGGRSWMATRLAEHGAEPWSWRLWRAQIDRVSGAHELDYSAPAV